jgi:hypothetical protein
MPKVTGPISTTADSDTYPTHDSLLGLGGLREVASRADRNAIPDLRRRVGMLVYTASDDAYWKLLQLPGTGTDADWAAFTTGGGGGGYPPVTYTLSAVSAFNQGHSFPYLPGVRLIDASGQGVDAGVEFPDASTVHIDFPAPFSGVVILS